MSSSYISLVKEVHTVLRISMAEFELFRLPFEVCVCLDLDLIDYIDTLSDRTTSGIYINGEK